MNFPAYPLPGLGSALKRRVDRAAGGVGRPLYCASVDRRKSKVWNYYTQLSETHVECNVCKKQLSFHNSTTTMREHLVRKHSIRDNGSLPPANSAVSSASASLLPPIPQPSFPASNTMTPTAAAACLLQPVVSLVVKEELQDADISAEPAEAKRARTTCGANGAGLCASAVSYVSGQEQDGAQASLSGLTYHDGSSASHACGTSSSSSRSCSNKRAGLLTELILEMVTRDLQPLSLVEDRGFRMLLGCLEPQYHMPSPSQVGSLLWHRYHVLKEHLKHHLQVSLAPRCLALCTERWRSGGAGGRLYSTMSAHFVDKDWRLARCVLETRPTPELEEEAAGQGGAPLGDILRAVLSEFHLPESIVFCVVHDTPWATEAAEVAQRAQGCQQQDRAMEAAGCFVRPGQSCAQSLPTGWVGLHCAGESLKLCVQEGLREEAVRQALGAARRIVSHFQHDVHAATALSHKAEAANKTGAQLLLDDPGRWATAIDMCESLLELKWVVSSVLEEQKVVPNLADHQWHLLQELVPVLKTVRIASAFLSEETNAPVSALMPCLHGVSRLLRQHALESGCAVARGVMEKMRSGMERRWRLGDEELLLDSPAVLSSFLDPRFKELRFLSPHTRSKLHDRVKELLSAQAYAEDGENDRGGLEDDDEEVRKGSRADLGLGLSDSLSASTVAPLDSPVSCGSAEEGDIILLKQPDSVTPGALAAPAQVSDRGLDGGVVSRAGGGAGLAMQPKGDVQLGSRERMTPAPQSMYDILLGEDPTERMPEIHQQLENYIAEPLCKRSLSPLHWWRAKEHRFPAVARLARRYLAIPATAVPADRAFAPRESSVSQRRATLGPQHLDHILFLHQNGDYVEHLKGGHGERRESASSSSVSNHGSQQTRESLYQSLVSYDNKAWVGGEEL